MTCALVLGMHRSGTSALTRVLNLLGYELPDRLIGALEGNEAGHWEPVEFVLFNDRLLGDLASSWHDFTTLHMAGISPRVLAAARTQLQGLLEREYNGAERIVLKDPRICRMADFYIDVLTEAGYRVVPIIAFRNPAEVVASLQRRRANWPEGFGATQAALLWLRHVLDAELASRGMARAFSNYDTLLADWRGELQRISAQGGLPLADPLALSAPLVDAFLSPEMKHEKAGAADLARQPALRGWCQRAFDALNRLVIDPAAAPAVEALDVIRRELASAELALQDLSDSGVEASRRAAALDRELGHKRADVAELSQLRDDLAAVLSERDADVIDLGHKVAAARAEHAAAQDRVGALEAETAARAEQVAALEAERVAREGHVADLETQRVAAQDRVQALEDERAAAGARLATLEDEHAALQDRLRALEAESAQGAQQLAQAVGDAAERGAKIDELNALLHGRNLQIDRMTLQHDIERQALLSSTSWRATAPLRAIGRRLQGGKVGLRMLREASARRGGAIPAARAALRIGMTEGLRGVSQRIEQRRQLDGAPEPAPPREDVVSGSCYIATTPHVASIAAMMARLLRAEGYAVTTGETLDGAQRAEHVFVLCPQMFTDLPDHYIAIQMEQSVTSRWFTPEYFDTLSRARAVIDYSMTNLDFLRRNGLPLYKLFYVPIDADADLLPSAPEPERSGILFFGDDKCPRRQRILSAVAAAYPQLRIVNNAFGAEIERELRQAAVVLNVHYYENALLETTRIYQALSHGTPVVSEEAVDQAEHSDLDGVVDFAPIDDVNRLIALLRPYVRPAAETADRRAGIARFVRRDDNRFAAYFLRFLLAQNMISYDRFCRLVPDYPQPIRRPAQVCLSLPETPERLALFVGQAQPDFQIWHGLKATPGWVGAALSYRQMFQRLVAEGHQQALVCEDDVLFPPDYDRRMAAVRRYLAGQDWDVFTGFIADVHEDMAIDHVEEVDGQTFVHVDRTVSMVFNIYNRGIMEFLASWNPDDRDVATNTIDRFLEGRKATKVILTLPFLVGHRPDAASTIWGFENTQYDALIEQSEIRLAEKVAAFRRRQAAPRA